MSEDDAAQTMISESGDARAVAPLEDAKLDGERYAVVRILGEGGMGEVRLCADAWVGRDVAMKVAKASAPGAFLRPVHSRDRRRVRSVRAREHRRSSVYARRSAKAPSRHPAQTAASLVIVTLVQLLLPAIVINRAVDTLVDAERRSFAQAWRLRQLLP